MKSVILFVSYLQDWNYKSEGTSVVSPRLTSNTWGCNRTGGLESMEYPPISGSWRSEVSFCF